MPPSAPEKTLIDSLGNYWRNCQTTSLCCEGQRKVQVAYKAFEENEWDFLRDLFLCSNFIALLN